MAAIQPSLSPELQIEKNKNLSFSQTNVPIKTINFSVAPGAETARMEVATRNPDDIKINDQIVLSTENAYFVQSIDKTPVKFGTGTPLVTQITNIRFPRPETRTYTPEKVATFLIFKK